MRLLIVITCLILVGCANKPTAETELIELIKKEYAQLKYDTSYHDINWAEIHGYNTITTWYTKSRFYFRNDSAFEEGTVDSIFWNSRKETDIIVPTEESAHAPFHLSHSIDTNYYKLYNHIKPEKGFELTRVFNVTVKSKDYLIFHFQQSFGFCDSYSYFWSPQYGTILKSFTRFMGYFKIINHPDDRFMRVYDQLIKKIINYDITMLTDGLEE